MAKKSVARWLLVLHIALLLMVVMAPIAHGQTLPSTAGDTGGQFGSAGPSDIVNTFYNGTQTWLNAIKGPAQALFWALATIDLTWTCITLVLQHQDLYPWMGGFIRKILTIGFFAVLLQNGSDWISDIVNFFINLGSSAGGRSVSSLSASGIMGNGIQLAGHMLSSAGSAVTSGSATNPISLMINGPSGLITAFALLIGAFVMVLVYVVIALHFVMAMVEAYVTVGAGYIFLGFGGSRWTVPYTEKYLGMVVAAGVRIMVLEMLIGLGSTLYPQWNTMAVNIAKIPDLLDGGTVTGQWSGIELEFALLASIAIYGLLCWQIPKIAANVVQGGLSMSGGDVLESAAAGASGGAAVASLMGAGSGSAQSGKAVSEVAQAAAMTGAQMGVQLGMAAMTGGTSAAVTGAVSGVAGAAGGGAGGASAVAGAAGAAEGFTPPPPGVAGGGNGGNFGPGENGSSGSGGGDAGGGSTSVLAGPSLAEDASALAGGSGGPSVGSGDISQQAEIASAVETAQESSAEAESIAGEAVRKAEQAQEAVQSGSIAPASATDVSGVGTTPGTTQQTTPPESQGAGGPGTIINTLRTSVNAAEQTLNKLPDTGGHVGGTNPKVDHGE